MSFYFDLLELHVNKNWIYWFGLLGVETDDFVGHFLYVEKGVSGWKFDVLWLRELCLKYFERD